MSRPLPSPHSGPQVIKKLPAYQQVIDAFRELIKGKAPGERLGTEGEFVRLFNVSLVTVRQALQRLENEGVIERKQGIGTFIPLDPLPRQHVAIYLETSPTHPFFSPYFLRLHEETRKALQVLGISCRSYLGDSSPEDTLAGRFSCPDLSVDYRLGRISGIITIGIGQVMPALERFGKVDLPIMDSRFRQSQGWETKSVFLREALAALRQQGRKHIAVLAWENPTLKVKPFHQDLIQIAQEYGIEIDRHHLDLNASALQRGMGWERFRDLWRSSNRKPDGLIILDDMIFDDCQRAILELGLSVPEQLGIFLYTSDAKVLNPAFPVTCFRLRTREISMHYAALMDAMLQGAPLPKRHEAYEIIHLSDGDVEELTPQPCLLNP